MQHLSVWLPVYGSGGTAGVGAPRFALGLGMGDFGVQAAVCGHSWLRRSGCHVMTGGECIACGWLDARAPFCSCADVHADLWCVNLVPGGRLPGLGKHLQGAAGCFKA